MLLGKLRTEYANKQGQGIVRIEFSSKMDFNAASSFDQF